MFKAVFEQIYNDLLNTNLKVYFSHNTELDCRRIVITSNSDDPNVVVTLELIPCDNTLNPDIYFYNISYRFRLSHYTANDFRTIRLANPLSVSEMVNHFKDSIREFSGRCNQVKEAFPKLYEYGVSPKTYAQE